MEARKNDKGERESNNLPLGERSGSFLSASFFLNSMDTDFYIQVCWGAMQIESGYRKLAVD